MKKSDDIVQGRLGSKRSLGIIRAKVIAVSEEAKQGVSSSVDHEEKKRILRRRYLERQVRLQASPGV